MGQIGMIRTPGCRPAWAKASSRKQIMLMWMLDMPGGRRRSAGLLSRMILWMKLNMGVAYSRILVTKMAGEWCLVLV